MSKEFVTSWQIKKKTLLRIKVKSTIGKKEHFFYFFKSSHICICSFVKLQKNKVSKTKKKVSFSISATSFLLCNITEKC